MEGIPDTAYRGARVALLGATGFIGRWVARALCARGACVALLVRDRTTAQPVLARYGIDGRLVALDLHDLERAGLAIRALAPSITFNLAGYGIDPAERDAEGAYQINAHLVGAIGEAMAEVRDPAWPGQDLVHAGSALEYGDVGGNLAEDCDPEPTTLYGQSKLAGTQSLSRCCADRGLRGLTARLFTVYGPGEHPGRLLPSLVRAARTGEPLGLTAGRQRRDFTFVADVAEGLLRLGLTRARPGDIVNLATGRLVTVRQFAETAARLLGMPDGRLRFGALPTRPAEMNHGPVNLDRLRGLIGWTPPTEVTDGILSTVAFEASSQSREAGHARSK